MAKPTKNTTGATTAPKTSSLDPDNRMRMIFDRCVSNPRRGVPVLIGPTQWGKTHYVAEYVRDMGRTLLMCNPQNDLPEDIAGWPFRDGDNVLKFTNPSMFPADVCTDAGKKKYAIFIDETDKAQRDTLSSFLTLLNPDERRLRHTRVPDEIPIFVGMNEPEGVSVMPDPLLARMLFLEFPYPGLDVSKRSDLKSIAGIVSEVCKMPTINFPKRPTAPGSFHKLVLWMKDVEFWTDGDYRATIVRGLFNEKDATVVLSRLKDQTPEASERWAKTVDPTGIMEHILDVMNSATYDQNVAIFTTLIDRANNDPTGEIERVLVTLFDTPEALYGVNRPEAFEAGKAALVKRFEEFKKSGSVAKK